MEEVWDLRALDLHGGPQRPPHIQDIPQWGNASQVGTKGAFSQPSRGLPPSSITDGVRWG